MINYIKNFFRITDSTKNFIEPDNPINVIWLHGANCSSLSFEYLRSITNFTKEMTINYSSMNKFYDNLQDIVEQVKGNGPHFVIGHSLGGLYALHLTQYVRVAGGISISTPFRGSSTADWAKYMVPSYQLFRDIGRKSTPIVEGNAIQLNIPWTQIVSTTGSVPYHNGPNDGVVTIASMTNRSDMEFIEVPHTHYEVMTSKTVADIILQRYATAQTNTLLRSMQ